MPFAPGVASNPTGRNGKQFKAALLLAIKRTEGDKTELARIAEALVEKAKTGDVQAINAVADRLDGKPTQLIAGDDEGAPILHRIERVIVDADIADRNPEEVQASPEA